MKSAIVGKDVETATVYQCSQVDQLALEHSADLKKWDSFDGGPLHWHRNPSSASVMARLPTIGNTTSDNRAARPGPP